MILVDAAAAFLLIVGAVILFALVTVAAAVILGLAVVLTYTMCGLDPNDLFEPLWDRLWSTDEDEEEDYL